MTLMRGWPVCTNQAAPPFEDRREGPGATKERKKVLAMNEEKTVRHIQHRDITTTLTAVHLE